MDASRPIERSNVATASGAVASSPFFQPFWRVSLAEATWRIVFRLDARSWWARTSLAMLFARAGDAGRAEEMLRAAKQRFPDEPGVAAAEAEVAEIVAAPATAIARWSNAYQRYPDMWPIGRRYAAALTRAGYDRAAGEVLDDIFRRFPDRKDALHDRARNAERLRDWARAEQSWTAYATLDERAWYPSLGLAAALIGQERLDEAELVLLNAQRKFPANAGVFLAHASIAQLRSDWPEMARRMDVAQARFPTSWTVCDMTAKAYELCGRPADAHAVLAGAVSRRRDAGQERERMAALRALIALCERMRNWRELERWSRELLIHALDDIPGTIALSTALRQQGQARAAERLVAAVMASHPDDLELRLERARVTLANMEWEAALARFEEIRRLMPTRADGVIGIAAACVRLGRHLEADHLIEDALLIWPSVPDLAERYAANAQERSALDLARRRRELARARFPNDPRFAPYSAAPASAGPAIEMMSA